MNKTDLVEVIIEVSATDATKGDIDQLTRQLLGL
jgi:hypothetical protein